MSVAISMAAIKKNNFMRNRVFYIPEGSDSCLRFFFSSFSAFLASLDAAFKAAFSLFDMFKYE